MKELFDVFLLELWRRAGALGLVVAGALAGFPVVILLSWVLDAPPAKKEISAAAVETWSGRLVDFRYDPTRGFIASLHSVAGEKQVLLAGIEADLCDRQSLIDAMKWFGRNVPVGSVLTVYVQLRGDRLFPMRAHLVHDNLWVNGSLVERGLAKVSVHSPIEAINAGRGSLCQLQEEARGHQRGIWRSTQ
jgi:hypothetical protein